MAREVERAALVGALDRAGAASSTILIHGPAGIGKTALLGFVIDAARQRGFDIVTARPTRAESPLAFAALADLLRDADASVLPDAERVAVDVALGRREASGAPPPQVHDLGFAVVDLLALRTGAGAHVAVVVDDIQWIDAATRAVLAFAARRLPAVGVCLFLGQRTVDHGAVLDDPLDVPEATRLELGALPPASIAALVNERAVEPLPGHLVDRIVTTAHGNPFYAIELARTITPSALRPGRPLAVPTSLAATVAGRVAALPASCQQALAAAAMLARPTAASLDQLGLFDELVAAERAGIVTIEGGRIQFTHPLLASAAHDALPGSHRLALRQRLAEVTSGTERCIHLALGAVRPDPAIADELALAVRTELARGAAAEAAELAILALEATPTDDPQLWRRRLMTADALFRAGRTDEAVVGITEVLAQPPDAIARTEALLAMATIEYSRTDDTEVATALARQALTSTDEPHLLAQAHTLLALVLYDDFDGAARHADLALTLIRQTGAADRLALASAIQASATARFMAGDGLDRAAFDEAIALEDGSHVPPADSAFAALAAMLKYADALDESQAMLESLIERADAGSLPYALSHLPQLHLWAGRWDAAEACAQRHLWFAERTFQVSQVASARFNLANLAAYRGDLTEAEQIGRELADEGRSGNIPWTERNGAALLGFVALSQGDATSAVRYLGRFDELGERMGVREPGYARLLGDYVEALIAIGEVVRATEVIGRLEARALRLGRRSALAATQRGRALLAAALGDREGALLAANDAITTLAGTPLVYERARAHLTKGLVARRVKERGVAREALTAALAEFERMGAASLAARARHELERVGGGRVQGVARLTPSESRVAELAAGGATTRQIADALFISTKTVEANLTRVYRKLAIANRAQLANAMAERQNAPDP